MHPITFLTNSGASLALLSEISDGDCARNATDFMPKQRLLESFGLQLAQLAIPQQVHGKRVLWLESPPETLDALPPADGIITMHPDIVLGITVADCVPVYLYHPQLGVAALLHAGREGTMKNIAGAAIEMISGRLGTESLKALKAYIGASAGPCCYEVSDALVAEFVALGLPACGRNLDLWQANAGQLMLAGVQEQNIQIARHCTICMGGYHSYRAHKTTARNIALLKR